MAYLLEAPLSVILFHCACEYSQVSSKTAGLTAYVIMKRSPCGHAGAPDASNAHSRKRHAITITDPPIYPGAVSPQPINQVSDDRNSGGTDLTGPGSDDLAETTSVVDEDSVASDSESLFPDENHNESDQQDVSFLCERCRRLDFDHTFSRQNVKSGGDPILWFYSKQNVLADKRCSLCQAMLFIYPSLDIQPDWKRRNCALVVTKHQDQDLPWAGEGVCDATKDKICLTFRYHQEPPFLGRQISYWNKRNVEDRTFFSGFYQIESELVGYLAEKRTIDADRDAVPAASIQPRVNFRMISKRLKECREAHEECKNKRSTYTQRVRGMRLIDCRTRTVVPAPGGDFSYAALSYVWGDSGNSLFRNGFINEDGSHKLPGPLPNTILDAILVTQKLNIRYLWIDRYCIRQDPKTKEEKDEKHGQIARMHQIYGGASITIIAAAGKGPDDGLPGVRTKRRFPIVRLPNRTLFATLPDPKLLVDTSAWSTRGWTFQEGILSRRLLVFTDQQVYFQCGQTGVAEAWDGETWREEHKFEKFGINKNMPLYPYFSQGDSVWPRIDEYVRLTMRYPQDILNGILGILTQYEGISAMRHVAGLPIDPRDSDPILWPQELAEALSWECDEPGERRAGFPTWSWTGWTCKGLQRNERFCRVSPDRVSKWSISIENTTEETDQSDLVALLHRGHDLSQVLCLRVIAPSLEAELIPMDGIPEKQRCWTDAKRNMREEGDGFDNNEGLLGVQYPGIQGVYFINLTNSKWLKSPFSCETIRCFAIITDEDRLDIPHYKLGQVFLPTGQDPVTLHHATALLVMETEDGFERIGVSGIDRLELRATGSIFREFRLI